MKLHYLTIFLLTVLGITSCSKNEDPTPAPITKANMIGAVNLYDQGTIPIDNSNMTIQIEGITPTISTTTNTNGSFTLLEVPFGTHTLVYKKSGVGTFKKIDIEHKDTGSSTKITNSPSLGEISTTKIANLGVSVNGNDIVLSITTNPAANNGNTKYVRYFLSTDSNVSNENYTFYSSAFISKITPFETTLSQNDLIDAGFSVGNTVYVKAYGDSFWSNQYDNPEVNRTIFPNLNMSSADAVSFVIP